MMFRDFSGNRGRENTKKRMKNAQKKGSADKKKDKTTRAFMAFSLSHLVA